MGRIKRVIPPVRFGVPPGISCFRTGARPVRTRVAHDLGHVLLDRGSGCRTGLTLTSTRGWTSSQGDCALTAPRVKDLPFPCSTLRGRPIPASAGNGYRPGSCTAGVPSGLPSGDASARCRRPSSPSGDLPRPRLSGSWCVPTLTSTQAWRPGTALRPRSVRGSESSGRDDRPRFGGTLRQHRVDRSRPRVRPRSFPKPPPDTVVVADGPASAGPDASSAPSVRPPPLRPRPVWPTAILGRRPGAPCRCPAPPGATSVALDAGRQHGKSAE
jgi:hypothetical protein